jgi:hypothetical protein
MNAAVERQAVVLAESQRRAVERTNQDAVPADPRVGFLPPPVWRRAAMSVVAEAITVSYQERRACSLQIDSKWLSRLLCRMVASTRQNNSDPLSCNFKCRVIL